MSGESRMTAISQNFFVFSGTTTTFSGEAREEKELTFRPKASARRDASASASHLSEMRNQTSLPQPLSAATR
jgi:hypothetical protein